MRSKDWTKIEKIWDVLARLVEKGYVWDEAVQVVRMAMLNKVEVMGRAFGDLCELLVKKGYKQELEKAGYSFS